MKRVVVSIFIFSLLFINAIWALNFRDPHLLFIRDFEILFFLLSSVFLVVSAMLQEKKWIRVFCLVFTAILLVIVSKNESYFYKYKNEILLNESNQFSLINKRFIVGFNDKNQIKRLAVNGIAGIFLTKRNIQGETHNSLKSFIEELQEIRKENDLPPLIITTDQEGGAVSRLSPLVRQQESLAIASSKGESSYEYGKMQGKWLNELGITVNFSPVIDLKPKLPPSKFDFHSLIATRAISSNPIEVVAVALPYVKGLEASGVKATLKHFPGLSRVQSDTHHFSARLNVDIPTLLETDLVPFTDILKSTSSWLMLSHVILESVDPKNPITTSNLVVEGIIRSKLGIDNVLITDDLTMGAIYNRGFCKSVVQSYSTTIDYLLIAYDDEKYFTAIKCISSHNE
ncbi:glycoside hydrolase family 3 N-terminal domain-containing protein [Cellvibrio sp.]